MGYSIVPGLLDPDTLQAARGDCAKVVSTFASRFGGDARGVYEPLALSNEERGAGRQLWRTDASVYTRRRKESAALLSSVKLVSFLLKSPRMRRLIIGLLGGESLRAPDALTHNKGQAVVS